MKEMEKNLHSDRATDTWKLMQLWRAELTDAQRERLKLGRAKWVMSGL